jgi:hypothetical protein
MSKELRFTFKLDEDERQRLELLSKHLYRSLSDTIRFLIRVAPLPRSEPPEGFEREIQEYWEEDEEYEEEETR